VFVGGLDSTLHSSYTDSNFTYLPSGIARQLAWV
jgi:hypothetical protein